ncbi:hypothetical protein [Streptomyces poriticola]|uniref:hypothetical protein n=1 Tax=Streptomyces poriticola TaxID=3120506 RepID=UPI002FCE564B
MADEQDRWLDRRTAELLLRGEPLDAVDPEGRERAERLAATLAALSPEPPATSEELPGEAAALAAFRKAHAERGTELDTVGLTPPASGHGSGTRSSGAGLVRIGGPGDGTPRPGRWGPLRLAMAAALTVGLVGGVGAAAGTGVLPVLFHGDEPDPGASVSAAASTGHRPDRPLVEPSPQRPTDGRTAPGGDPTDPADPADGGTAQDEADGDPAAKPRSDAGDGRTADRRKALTRACRDLREGSDLDRSRKRALIEAAGGPARVRKLCKRLLTDTNADIDANSGKGSKSGKGDGDPQNGRTESDTEGDEKSDRQQDEKKDEKNDGKSKRGDEDDDDKDAGGDRGDRGDRGGRKGRDGDRTHSRALGPATTRPAAELPRPSFVPHSESRLDLAFSRLTEKVSPRV